MAWISGAHQTDFGRLEGEDSLTLMASAATRALADAGLERGDVDGLLCGYSTALPHLMLASVFAEYFGLDPTYCHTVQVGGGTGAAMTMLAKRLCDTGQCDHILIVAGENRLSGEGSDRTVQTLAGVGHPDYETPFGPTIPGYYALLAARYMHEHGLKEEDLAVFSVLMRQHASRHPGSHFSKPITIDDVMASRMIATPLKLLDCCPISDGGCALVVSAEAPSAGRVCLAGAAQVHPFQHVVAAPSLTGFKSADAAHRALAEAGVSMTDIQIAGVYDSFSITLLVFLEELGLAPRGEAANAAREGHFSFDGRVLVNTHGGLMSFGHSGVAGGMAHIVEVYQQMTGKVGGARQLNSLRCIGDTFTMMPVVSRPAPPGKVVRYRGIAARQPQATRCFDAGGYA